MFIIKSYIKYRNSRWYNKIINFLLNNAKILKKCERNKIKNVKRLNMQYKFTNQHLLYIKKMIK